jgi:hypothetical protein
MNQTEQEMRDAEVPWVESTEELVAYINGLTDRNHDYGTCVYAMSMAAMAAFHYVGNKLGTTGFQASCADMDILRRSRMIKGPFMLIDGNKMLYPQYDLRQQLEEAIKKWKPWAAEEAQKLLDDKPTAHENVIAHWKQLATTGKTNG